MSNNFAAVKTYKELRNLDVREASGYFKKFYEFLTGTIVSYGVEKRLGEIIETAYAIDLLGGLLIGNQANGKKLMVIGNGGSAGIAMHTLADYANAGGLKTLDFYGPALLTCMSNDYGYESVFAKPVEMFAEPGDMLFAISSSGKSPNILNACQSALAKNCQVITFSGFSRDNPLRKLGHLNFYVPSAHYGFVELAHQTLIHCILDLFIRKKIYEEEREASG